MRLACQPLHVGGQRRHLRLQLGHARRRRCQRLLQLRRAGLRRLGGLQLCRRCRELRLELFRVVTGRQNLLLQLRAASLCLTQSATVTR